VGLVIREHCETEGVARGGRDGAGGKRERFPEERTCVPHRRGPRAIGVGAPGWVAGPRVLDRRGEGMCPARGGARGLKRPSGRDREREGGRGDDPQ